MADIFVSYKREDREIADRVTRALAGGGFSAWWDTRLLPAQQWDEEIEREIADAKAVLVLWTPRSVSSKWVRSEATFAMERNKLVPVVLEDCEPPLAFRLVQSVDLRGWDGTLEHPGWRRLDGWLRDLVDGRDMQVTEPLIRKRDADWRVFGEHLGEPVFRGATITRTAPPGTFFRDGEHFPLMCVLPPGSFVMGAEVTDPGLHPTECPARTVGVAFPFAMAVYPTTFDEWDLAVDSGAPLHRPNDHGWGRGNRPVVDVSYNDAQKLAQWLSSTTDEAYRLPTEAEWEYACRAGTTTPWSTPREPTPDDARFAATSTSPVGSFAPNAFGLYDMHGNVREWVVDAWHDSYAGAPLDVAAWNTGHSAMRVTRGGAWIDGARFLRSAARSRGAANDRANFIGFRLVREIR